jgi:hypothetical protein
MLRIFGILLKREREKMYNIILAFKICLLIYLLAFFIALMVIGIIVFIRKLSRLGLRKTELNEVR